MNLEDTGKRAIRAARAAGGAVAGLSGRAVLAGLGVTGFLALALFVYLIPPQSLEEPPETVTFFQIGTGSVFLYLRGSSPFQRPAFSLKCPHVPAFL